MRQAKTAPARTIFITGTDTGVGKTLLTALLYLHLCQKGKRAVAMKPFCSGGTADVDLLYAIQNGELSKREINPFFFPEPIAPLVSARFHRRKITLQQTLDHIRNAASKVAEVSATASHRAIPFILIEGSGGLLVPLGEEYTVADLIAKLRCEVIVASRNRLGTINHTLMTVRILQSIGVQQLAVVLMDTDRRVPSRRAPARLRRADPSTISNSSLLRELLDPIPVHEIPFLGQKPGVLATLKKSVKKFQKTLARICC